MNSADISIEERKITKEEVDVMKQSFDEDQLAQGIPLSKAERHEFAALEDDKCIGLISGLRYGQVFFLSDLWLETSHRGHGLGSELVQKLEEKLKSIGITLIYTWTASFQAPGFYKKHGYEIFTELENYYEGGHSAIGLRKSL